MFITKNTLRYKVPALFLFLFLLGSTFSFANTRDTRDGVIATKSVTVGATSFTITVKINNATTGNATISATETPFTTATSILSEDIYFFIILPDGNWVTLTQSNTYQTPYTFETGTSTMFNVSNLQVWAFKKNDPTPPPAGLTFNSQNTSGGSTFTTNGAYNAAAYLNAGQSQYVKIGASWSPWNHQNAVYYMVITYGNRGNTTLSGKITMDSCAVGTFGFTPVKYTTYNLLGTKAWAKDVGYPTSGFTFSNLLPGEVRHIYVKMERNTQITPAPPQYTATMKVSPTTSYLSNCTELILSGSPHDPNRKTVDQLNCTKGGQGTLKYMIVYQNEGTAPATIVTVTDVMHSAISLSSVAVVGRSANIPNLTPALTNSSRTYTFTMGTTTAPHNLPGLGQYSPRRYTYDETIGWIQVKTNATCPFTGGPVTNKANIVFTGNTGVQPPVTTTTATTQPDLVSRPTWPIIVNPNPTGQDTIKIGRH